MKFNTKLIEKNSSLGTTFAETSGGGLKKIDVKVLGDTKSKVYSFKIKNIYLGFKVQKKDENMILKLSSKKRFGVYKMKSPEGKHEISYDKLN